MDEISPIPAAVDAKEHRKIFRINFGFKDEEEAFIRGYRFIRESGKSGITNPNDATLFVSNVIEGEVEYILKLSKFYGLRLISIIDVSFDTE